MENSQRQQDVQSYALETDRTLQNAEGGVPTGPTDTPRHRQWHRRKRLVVGSLALLLLAAGTPYGIKQWQYYEAHESTDDAYVVGHIIPISARVAGTVLTVYVEDHQPVEAGQLLARLDPQDFETQVQEAEAAVAMAEADLSHAKIDVEWERQNTHSETERTRAVVQEARSDLQQARHDVEAAQAHLRAQEAVVSMAQAEMESREALFELARTGFERLQQLQADGVIARQQFDESATQFRAAQAALRASQRKLTKARRDVDRARIGLRTRRQAAMSQATARLAAARAIVGRSQANQQKVNMKQVQVRMAQARLQQHQTALAQAHFQLAHATLRAPISGVIAKSHLEVGLVVQVGQPLLAIVPLHDVWVEANYKETQLHRMQPGQSVSLKVDAYPGKAFHGTVQSLSPGTGSTFSLLPPENATGNFVKVVQRVPVKIALKPQNLDSAVLRPGMSVIATVDLREP